MFTAKQWEDHCLSVLEGLTPQELQRVATSILAASSLDVSNLDVLKALVEIDRAQAEMGNRTRFDEAGHAKGH